MAVEVLEPFFKGDTGRNTRGLLRLIILCTIAAAAVASRLFSVIRKSSPFRPERLPRHSEGRLASPEAFGLTLTLFRV